MQLLPAVVFTEAVPAALRHHLIICPDKVFMKYSRRKRACLEKLIGLMACGIADKAETVEKLHYWKHLANIFQKSFQPRFHYLYFLRK